MKVNRSSRGASKSSSPLLPSPPPPSPPSSPVDNSSSLWRFWKWIPPAGARPVCGTDDYGQLMASFKEHLAASPTLLFAINELRLFATLEAPSILDYVNEEGPSEGGRGGFSGTSSSSSLVSAFSSSSSSSLGAPSSASHSPGSSSSGHHHSSHSISSVRGYYIFKDGIWPLWEDEYNVAGGCWTFRHTVRSSSSSSGGVGQPREMWKRLILTLSDPHMAPFLEAGEITGAGLTVRQTGRSRWSYKFSIWNSNADNTISKLMIGATLKSLVSLPNGSGNGNGNGSSSSSSRLFYYSHRTNMQHQHSLPPTPSSLLLPSSSFSVGGGNSGGGGLKRKAPMAPRNDGFSFLGSYGVRGGGGGGRGGGGGGFGAVTLRKKSVTFLE